MNSSIRRMTASLAGVIIATSSVCSIGADAFETGIKDSKFQNELIARAKIIIGNVTKSEPTDATRTAYGSFVPCKVGDQLPEATLVQTAAKSTAEIKWQANGKDAGTIRLWAGSVATINSKTRLVYLQKGELRLNKVRGVSDQWVETKLLQARIHGTTVRVWSEGDIDKIVVMETDHKSGVEIKNKVNGSKFNLQPGIVLEVRGVLPTSMLAPASKNVCLKPEKGELIFRDDKTETVVYTANSKAILEDPLLVGFDGLPPMDSLDLVKRDMKEVPSSDNIIGNVVENAFNMGRPDKLITKAFSISSVPTKTRYYVGPNIGQGKSIDLPSLAYTDFHPAGRIADTSYSQAHVVANAGHPVITPVQVVRPLHELGIPATDTKPEILSAGTHIASPFMMRGAEINLPTQAPVQIPVQVATPVVPVQVPVQIAPIAPIQPMQAPVQFITPQQQVVPFNSQNLSVVPFNQSQAQLPANGAFFSKNDNTLPNLGKAN